MLDREGATTPADVLLVGTEPAIARAIARIATTGATDLLLAPIGTPAEQRVTTAALTRLRQA